MLTCWAWYFMMLTLTFHVWNYVATYGHLDPQNTREYCGLAIYQKIGIIQHFLTINSNFENGSQNKS